MPAALGFIETDSFYGAIEASNVMAGISNIILLGKEVLSPGSITIKIIGEKESVEAALNAGIEAVKNLGKSISSHIIVDPDEQLLSVLPEISGIYFFLKKNSKKEIKKHKIEKSTAQKTGVEKVEPEKSEIIEPKSEMLEIKKKEAADQKVKKLKPEKLRVEKPRIEKLRAKKPRAEKPKDEETRPEKTKVKEPVPEKLKIEEAETEKAIVEKTLPDPLIIHRDLNSSTKSKPAKIKNVAKKIAAEKIPEKKEVRRVYYKNDTIERLRKEALGLNKPEKKKPLKKEIKEKTEKKKEVKKEEKKEPGLESFNVHQLRKQARSTKNFPIQGREISKANRDLLLEYFKTLK